MSESQELPPDIETATAERESVVAELRELEVWLGGRSGVMRWKQFHTERATKAHRVKQLGLRARQLRDHIAALHRAAFDAAPKKVRDPSLTSDFYHGVAELEERGVDIGDRLRGALRRFEQLTENDDADTAEAAE